MYEILLLLDTHTPVHSEKKTYLIVNELFVSFQQTCLLRNFEIYIHIIIS